MLGLHLARQALQQAREARTQVRMRLGASRFGGAGFDEAVEGGLVVGGKARRQDHVGRCHAVDHGAPHRLRKLAQDFERDPRSVGAADQVDPLGTELAPHRVEILHGDRRGDETEVALRLQVGLLEQRRLALREEAQLPFGIGLLGQRLVFRILAGQGRRAAGAALVDEDDVAPVVEAREKRHRLRGQRHRALPGAAGEKEHRVGELAPRHRRDHDVLDLQAAALGMLGIERPLHAAAQHAVAKPGDVTFGQRCRCRLGRRSGKARRERREGCQRREAPHRLLPHSPSVRFSSPLAIKASISLPPPTSTPLTKTIGKVGQPVHIFSALRRRHSLK